MEFLRFGSSIPGGYWGCCAMCIIQNFKFDPDAKASIQLVSGDGGTGLIIGGEPAFAGPTYRDIFKQRIRIGTFSTEDMPNHGFLAVLTSDQIAGGHGKKWLQILKEEGFEFIRTVDNSVYTGAGMTGSGSSHPNYLFGLFRNITGSRIKDPFKAPAAWTNLPDPYNGDMSPENMTKVQKDHWLANSPTKLMKKSEIVAAGAPVIMAGLRTQYPPEPEATRESKKAANSVSKVAKANTSAFPTASVAA